MILIDCTFILITLTAQGHNPLRQTKVYMALSATKRLKSFYNQFSGDDQVIIIINADPDAIASAMAVKRLLWRKVANVTLSNINVITRPDNIAMVRLLDINLVHINKIDKERFTRFVIVDSQPSHNEIFKKFEFNVIIDHHPETDTDAPFSDIRPEYGATASIMTEYLRAAKIKPSVKLATALFYAIKTDTNNFKNKTIMEDIRAFQFLFKHANIHLARKIDRAEIQPQFLKYFEKALRDKRMRRDRLFVHLGTGVSPDICVIIADFFMRVNTVKWSIVSGIYKKKLNIIFRNDGLRKNAGKLAKESFGNVGDAGGHKSMARAEIPFEALKDVVDPNEEKKVLRWIINRIEKRAAKKTSAVNNEKK